MPESILPVIPETITVHLGRPDSAAQNVTVSFPDYIKNVASSEIYPTWPENAIRANIYAQISFALNRVYTEFYRNQGYDFEITNSTANDQSFVYGRDIFDNISEIVDEIFNSYIRRQGQIEPLFSAYCDGIEVSCNGLSQWGSVSLAEEGMTPYEILQYYYGDDIDIVRNVPVEGFPGSAPEVPLRLGDSGPDVQFIQRRLNRISTNYPLIPKIYPINGVFGPSTEEAVKTFQSTFGLTPDGIVGPATWYRIQYVYVGVKRLSDLASEGLTYEDVTSDYPSTLAPGDNGQGVRILQYYLSYLSSFNAAIPRIAADGSYGPATERAVRAFQTAYGLTPSGTVDALTWDRLQDAYRGIVSAVPPVYTEGSFPPFPGTILGVGSQGDDVRALQEYLNAIAEVYPQLPTLPVTGYFGTQTADAVSAFLDLFGIEGARGSVNGAVWNDIGEVYSELSIGSRAAEGQYPGYELSQA